MKRTGTRAGVPISIHAPPRGATKQPKKYSAEALFQFTPLREGRHAEKTHTLQAGQFQFTPLREGRHVTGARQRRD